MPESFLGTVRFRFQEEAALYTENYMLPSTKHWIPQRMCCLQDKRFPENVLFTGQTLPSNLCCLQDKRFPLQDKRFPLQDKRFPAIKSNPAIIILVMLRQGNYSHQLIMAPVRPGQGLGSCAQVGLRVGKVRV